jgi:hypothetical protein
MRTTRRSWGRVRDEQDEVAPDDAARNLVASSDVSGSNRHPD